MSWNHSSKLGVVVLSVLVALAVVGLGSAAVVTNEEAPDSAEVGTDVNVTVELEQLFSQESSWELNGHTELENPQWTVELYDNGTQYDTRESSGSSPDSVLMEEGITEADKVVVHIEGTAPQLTNATYDDPATFLGGEVVQVVDDGADVNYLSQQRVPLYSEESQEARTALDDANATISSAASDGDDVSDAESTFQDAVAAYDDENFTDATSLAEDAASQAESTDSGSDDGSDGSDETGETDAGNETDAGGETDTSDDGTDTGANNSDADGSGDSDDGGLLWPILYGVLGLLVLGAVGGGVYWYQQQQQGPSRDPLG